MRAESGLVSDHTAVAGKPADVPLIAHVIFRLDTGGLENGLVNLINRMPVAHFRHAIICLTDYSEFRQRIQRSDVEVYALNKPPGNGLLVYYNLWRLFRQLRPTIVHTRNLAALEATVPAALAGVAVRIHGEHGRDVNDLDGNNRKYQTWRRVFKPFVSHYISVSRDLESYLLQKIGVDPARLTQIYNGVDSGKFASAGMVRAEIPHPGFCEPRHFVIGTVGRMQEVKDQVTLARAFVLLMQQMPQAQQRLRLVMIGDGPLRERVRSLLADAGVLQYAWLPGEHDDVACIMRAFDLFVLPSLAEGISNTILEAMATGLPIVATAVGGNVELVSSGETGMLVPAADPGGMAIAIRAYVQDPDLCRRHGKEARRITEDRFSMDAMVNAYMAVYEKSLARKQQIVVGA